MAEKVVVERVDDFGGDGEAFPVHFTYQGTDHVIDLNEANREKFHDFLQMHIDAGREFDQKKEVDDIRAWAEENGYQVQARGRLPMHVVEAYKVSAPTQ